MQTAEGLFGKKKTEALLGAFREADRDRDGKVGGSEIGKMLRSQGLAPTEKQVGEFVSEIAREGGNFTGARFLEFAVKCGKNDARASDLAEFFAPYDTSNSGKIPVKVFRNLMENVGEPFRRGEVDELVRDFANGEVVDYKAMLQM
jgi:Ca2+-binding EF-hand superfamily protein